MIIEIKKEHIQTVEEIKALVLSVKARPDVLFGDLYTVIAVEGDASLLNLESIEAYPGVVRAWRISSPYKSIAKQVIGKQHEKVDRERSTIEIPGKDGLVRKIGDHDYLFIAGPCTVESYDQVARIGDDLAVLADKLGIKNRMMMRAGVFKPRTRPLDFRGLGYEALDFLDKVRNNTGFPYVTEVMSTDQVSELSERADMLQIGTRNFQNFNLLEEVGRQAKPILYKRGIAATLDEWLSACEYIALQGNKKIILCERGVKSTVHGDYNRTHIDFDAVFAIRERTVLPVVIDPSHSAGNAPLVPFQFCAASAYKANGTITEVIANDTDRKHILCDGKQGVRIKVYEKMVQYHLKQEELNYDFSEA